MAAGSMIEIKGVGKHFQQRKGTLNVVLEDIDLTIRRGEFVSLVGQSGCGKTTLLRMIAGLAPYSPGEIKVNGKVVRTVPPRIGFVFQNAALLPWKTVHENVLLGLNETRGLVLAGGEAREGRAAARADRARRNSATTCRGSSPAACSSAAGSPARSSAEPDVLLMDEPFGAVDALTRIRLQEELAAIVERTEATVVFVTHDVEEAVFLADRVAVMTTGPGTIKEVIDVDLPRPRERRAELLAPLSEHVLELVLGGGHRRRRRGDGAGMSGLTFGVRVPNSGPLSTIENIVRAAKAAGGARASTRSGCTTTSCGARRCTATTSRPGSVDALEDDQTATFFESLTTLAISPPRPSA